MMCDALQLNWKLNPNVSNKAKKSSDGNKASSSPQHQQQQQQSPEEAGGLTEETAYALRACSIQKRMETEHRKTLPRKRGPKPRPKSAPMSKYRRKTANLRERQRMGEINVAFEKLRDKIPNPVLSGRGKCEKLTKINILHVAINYIRAMENLLDHGDSGVRSFSEMVRNPIRPNDKPTKFEGARISLDSDEDDDDDDDIFPTLELQVKQSGSSKRGLATAQSPNKRKKEPPRKSSNRAKLEDGTKPASLPSGGGGGGGGGLTSPVTPPTFAQVALAYQRQPSAPQAPQSASPRCMSIPQAAPEQRSFHFMQPLPPTSITSPGAMARSSTPLKSYTSSESLCSSSSSDSGISSSSLSPVQEAGSGEALLDPLLSACSGAKVSATALAAPLTGSSSGSTPGLFDLPVTDDLLDLVDSLQGDFPDIASLEDTFPLEQVLPKGY